MSKAKYLEGPLHKIRVKEVSQRYLQRTMAAKGEIVAGGFVAEENCIYILKDADRTAKLQILLHEAIHAADHQTSLLDEEARADVWSSWLIRLFKATGVEELYK
jgi:hypothetical protein